MDRPHVGLGVLIRRGSTILLGKRKNAYGEGMWGAPGGHLEYGETFDLCALREIEEEVGVKVKNMMFATATNDVFVQENKHYVTIIMVADWKNGEAEVKEKDRFECWQWFNWSNLPERLFLPARNALKQSFNPFKV